MCCRDTNGFIIHVKTEDIYKDIAEDAEKGFNTSNYNIDTLLPKGENEKVIGLMKDELGGKIVTKFVGLRLKIYSYLKDNNDEGKKAKGTIIKKPLNFRITKTEGGHSFLPDKFQEFSRSFWQFSKSFSRYKLRSFPMYKLSLASRHNEGMVTSNLLFIKNNTSYSY